MRRAGRGQVGVAHRKLPWPGTSRASPAYAVRTCFAGTERDSTELQRLTADPAQCGGRPYLRGLRIRVVDILDLLAAGSTRHEIVEDHLLFEDGDITAGLEYGARASDHVVLRTEELPKVPRVARGASASTLSSRRHRPLVGDAGLEANHAGIWATIITKDRDFVQLRAMSGDGPPVVWVKIANTRRAALFARNAEALPGALSALDRKTLIEVARRPTASCRAPA